MQRCHLILMLLLGAPVNASRLLLQQQQQQVPGALASTYASAAAGAESGSTATASATSSSSSVGASPYGRDEETYAQAAAEAASASPVKPYKQLDTPSPALVPAPVPPTAGNISSSAGQQPPSSPVSQAPLGPAPDGGSPIRIKFNFDLLKSNGSLLTAEQAAVMETELLPAAAQRLASLILIRNPVSGPLKAPLSSLATAAECGFQLPAALSQGVPDADYVLVAFADHPICRDTGTLWFAQAKYCDFDPATGRPTLGGMLVCPNFFSISSTSARVESLVHEAFHAMGFTQNALPSWRNFATEQVYSQVVQRSSDGNKPSWLLTPRVKAVAQQYFSCPTLPGGPLDMTTGMHWWQKALPFEILIGRSEDGTSVTPFTLAAMEDTGWYIGNYAAAANPTQNKGAGCAAGGLS